MRQLRVGQRVRVLRAGPEDGVCAGEVHVIDRIDASDDTLLLRLPSGRTSGWISFDAVQGVGTIGWSLLAPLLPDETRRLLEAFDGIEAIELNERVKARILLARGPRELQRLIMQQVDQAGRAED